MRSDEANAGTIGVILMVGVVAVSGAGVWAWVTKFQAGGEPAVALQATHRRHACGSEGMVVALTSDLPLADLAVAAEPAGGGLSLVLAGARWNGARWDAPDPAALVGAGAPLRVWTDAPRVVMLVHAPSGSLAHRFSVGVAAQDAEPPSATLDLAASTPDVLRGSASDAGCSGVVSVTLRLLDADTGAPVASAPAQLASPGATSTAWSLPLAPLALPPGGAYDVELRVDDAAGNADAVVLARAIAPPGEEGEHGHEEEEGGEEGEKVELCHRPPGNPAREHTIRVGRPAVDAHLAHGDHLGPCEG